MRAASVGAFAGCTRGYCFHHAFEVEAAGFLAWRVFPEALQPLPDVVGRWRDQEGVIDIPVIVIDGLILRSL